ncbi:MAG: nucleotidyltransferase family protein [Planctomycetes bacterium]|nr:nucleotidyltransferase family protein [Planctomycetota bacterium]
MDALTDALVQLASLFERLKVPYAVMGGLAVRIYAIPRATYDLDFTLAVDRDRLPEFYAALEGAGYTVPEPYLRGWVDEVAGLSLVKVRLYLGEKGVDVDVFLAESPYQHGLLSRRRREAIDGTSVWFVSPEDLILLKLVAGRPRDVSDVQDVLFTQGQLDE